MKLKLFLIFALLYHGLSASSASNNSETEPGSETESGNETKSRSKQSGNENVVSPNDTRILLQIILLSKRKS